VSPLEWAQRLAAPSSALTLPGAHNFVFNHPEAASEAIRGLLPRAARCTS